MNAETKEAVTHRLRSVAGHVRSIERMVADDLYCIDIIHQIDAVQAALAKVSSLILDDHLRTCVISAVQGNDANEREKALAEISELYSRASKR